MVLGMRIAWQPIEALPADRKDGRTVLLWADGEPALGRWVIDPPGRPTWSGWEEPQQWTAIENVTHYAEINPPD